MNGNVPFPRARSGQRGPVMDNVARGLLESVIMPTMVYDRIMVMKDMFQGIMQTVVYDCIVIRKDHFQVTILTFKVMTLPLPLYGDQGTPQVTMAMVTLQILLAMGNTQGVIVGGHV
jgi:hypothetical protein